MYFPYFRGRQFELIALRELLDKSLLSNKITPIIEPVKLSSTLVSTVQKFIDAGKDVVLVRNPQVGNFIDDINDEKNETLKGKILECLRDEKVYSILYVNGKLKTTIKELKNDGQDISRLLTICNNPDYLDVFEEVFASEMTSYNLIPDESVFRRRVRKNRVIFEDKFRKQSRNVDYAVSDDEAFSSDHLYYKDDGYVGFSDYSIIGNEYTETGFAPYAVAIHIVYFTKDDSLRVKHFVSESNDDISDPAGKFAEAVEKMVDWNKEMAIDTLGISKLTEMYEAQVYPGLGTVKKLSVMHHLELLGKYLDKGSDK